MRTIELASITIPDNRQRREFDEGGLRELAKSITEVSLLQPIVLRDDLKTLVAGERRVRAVASLTESYLHDGEPVPVGSIPFVCLSDLSADQLYQAELEENVCRRDLSWPERCAALKRFHDMRSKQAAMAGREQTITATATEVNGRQSRGTQITEVNNAILLADFLDDPEVVAQPTMADALKVVRDQHKQRQRKALAATVDFSKSPHVLHLEDSLVDAPRRYSNYFDVVVTDPPYGIEAHKKDTFDVSKHKYDDSPEMFARVLERLPDALRAITRANAHVYVFCDIRRFEALFVEFELAGFTVWPRPLIWDKGNTGSYGNIEYGFRACYDAILFARKGDRKMATIGRDVLNITQPTNLPHPAGKPPALYEQLLLRSAQPGDKVADLFGGSCPIFPAATKLKLYATAWENHPDYIPMAQESLSTTIVKG